MTNQERSIFHSNGMPLRFSQSAQAGRVPSLAWMSPFSNGPQAQALSYGAQVSSDPALDVAVDGEETPAFSDAAEQAVVSQKDSPLAAGQVTPVLAPSFSWPLEPHRPDSPVTSSSTPSELAGAPNGKPEPAGREQHPEHSMQSMLAGPFDEPARPHLGGVKIVPRSASDEPLPGLTAPAFTRDKGTSSELGANPLSGERLQASVEVRSEEQSLRVNALETLRLGRAQNRSTTAPAVKVTASGRSLDPQKASSPAVITSGEKWIANTFPGRTVQAETLSTLSAPKSDAIEVLEKLSFGASPAASAPRPGRQVHIGKLHITVQRPAVAAPQQSQAPVAGVRQHTSAPAGSVFPDPWERHYSSFD